MLPPQVVDDPEIFGMHQNANTTFNTTTSLILMAKILSLQPRASGGGDGKSPDEIVMELVETFQSQVRTPHIAQNAKAFKKYSSQFLSSVIQVPAKLEMDDAGPTTFVLQPNGLFNSLAIVLTQEMIKFNRLINSMNSSLRNVKLAIQGQCMKHLKHKAMAGSVSL